MSFWEECSKLLLISELGVHMKLESFTNSLLCSLSELRKRESSSVCVINVPLVTLVLVQVVVCCVVLSPLLPIAGKGVLC